MWTDPALIRSTGESQGHRDSTCMMRQFWFLLYNGAVIPGLWIVLKFGSLFNAKIRHGIAGRVNLFGQLEQQARARLLRNKTE